MIIDVHGHFSPPAALWVYRNGLLAARGSHGRVLPPISDDQLVAALHHVGNFGGGHLELIDARKTDFQLISPRPFQMMHSEKPARIVQWFHEECHNIIHRQVKLFPDRFAGVCMLPQIAGEPITVALPELERCIKEMGFVGCLVDSDPYENSGTEAPPMSDRYWYPLYEKLCELDVPAMLHGCGSRSARISYSGHFINEETTATLNLVNSSVFEDFPNLKFIIPHGGGAIPYQIGRFDAPTVKRDPANRFATRLRKLWFDTTLYSAAAVELLIKTVGADRCLFGTECPGTGSAKNPDTDHPFDDVATVINSFDWLSDEDKKKIFEDNAREIFKLSI